jgi:DNA end-binding protein Ku
LRVSPAQAINSEEVTEMPNAIWRGDISFGLVTVPVELRAAEQPRTLAFRMLDKRNLAPVKQKRVNEATGEEVPWDEVVKGYEHEDGKFVVVTDDDFRAANVEATKTIDIFAMVKAEEIPLIYFDKPYYLAPATPAARKAYAILRETLEKSGYIGLAYIVVRSRQHAAALVPYDDVLMLEMLRYPHELRDAADLDLPVGEPKDLGITEKELKLASQLVDAMVDEFDPSQLKDTYYDDLMALIERKVETGEVEVPPEVPEAPAEGGEVVDIMDLLKRSLEGQKVAKKGA